VWGGGEKALVFLALFGSAESQGGKRMQKLFCESFGKKKKKKKKKIKHTAMALEPVLKTGSN